ncbi:MAG TPA: 4Fe-4S dicluster domain-containing protein [Firmicutes bacterium]|nr:4Fe-4S dicluster domain-containing protein [Bacillota bacterium]
MSDYFHAVYVDQNRCNGCTRCLRVCPTQAMRIRHGKAVILENKCIDCGECMRVCPQKAISAKVDALEMISGYKHKLLVYSPVFFGQFRKFDNVKKILGIFKLLGFDDIIGVDTGGVIISDIIKSFLKDRKNIYRPYISTNCPAVVRLIQVKFPSLINHLLPLRNLMDVAGEYIKHNYKEQTGVLDDEIGLFYLSPCPAKVVAIYQPEAEEKRIFNGVFSLGDMYNEIRRIMEKQDFAHFELEETILSSKFALRWSALGDVENKFNESVNLRIDGIQNAIRFLERLENGEVKDIDFVDMYSCDNACVGGVFTKEDAFIAEYRIKKIAEELPDNPEIPLPFDRDEICSIGMPLKPRPISPLDSDIKEALKKMKKIEEVNRLLPQLNCGMCGCPTCYDLAEDIIIGKDVSIYDCPVILKERLRKLSREIVQMAGHMNPIEDDREKKPPT